MTGQSHEVFSSFRTVSASSNRKFGLAVGGILIVLALAPFVLHHKPVRLWLLVPGVPLFVLGAAAPAVLAPLNRLWFRLGLLLGRMTNPIVMGVLFYAVVVPMGWLLRRRGHDLLDLRRDGAASSYWIQRSDSAPAALKNQF